jgi:2-deoxy-D-gluconate 3-dehydrogenase
MSLFDLTGKVAIVTGGNKGLGRGIAVALAQAGADVAVVSTRPEYETVDEIQGIGRKAIHIAADLTSISPIEHIIETTLNGLGGLEILVNNAGMIRRADSVDFTEADWDAVIDLNLKSAFFLAQAAGRHMIAEGAGKIINIASMLSFQGGIRVPSYTASKSGIAGITKLLANEWAAKGINVNAIAPGYMGDR